MGDRATAPIEDIWCEKIRDCSFVGRVLINRDCGASYSNSAGGEMTRWAKSGHLPSFGETALHPGREAVFEALLQSKY
jgi:hypothetical protein